MRRASGVVAVVLIAGQPQPFPDVQTFLRTAIRFSGGDLTRLGRGEPVVKVLPSAERREIAVFGAVRIAESPEAFVALARDVVAFRKSSMVLQVGRVGAEPALEDFAALTLDREDFEALRACRPGDCDVRLDAAAIERFRTEVAWSAPSARDTANALFRDVVYTRAAAYWRGGMEALAPYNDHESPNPAPAADFSALLQPARDFFAGGSAIAPYLERFPAGRHEFVEDFLYWSKEQFGLKPVVSVTHTSIHRPEGLPTVTAVIASRQIYASHYFNASLGLATVVPVEDGAEGFYLLYLNRSRSDSLRGMFRALLKSSVQRRTRDGMERTLAALKVRLERT